MQCASLNQRASAAAGYFNSNLPIYLKPLRSSAFDQRASSVLQTDCLIDHLLHCCFTASFDKLKLKIDVFVLDERINYSDPQAACRAVQPKIQSGLPNNGYSITIFGTFSELKGVPI